MRSIRRATKGYDVRDFYTAMSYDPNAKIGFVKYRRYFSR